LGYDYFSKQMSTTQYMVGCCYDLASLMDFQSSELEL